MLLQKNKILIYKTKMRTASNFGNLLLKNDRSMIIIGAALVAEEQQRKEKDIKKNIEREKLFSMDLGFY